jgi:eukaryotic-like serine/threonine-protein kinase
MEPPRPPRSPRRRALLGTTALTTAAAIAALVHSRTGERRAAPAAVSPLAAATAVLACPALRASGVDEPAGWLGAAAASVACERGRVLLGGRPERTLAPAELLDLPRGPADQFPADPYGARDARDRALAAARQRAQAYLDGEVAVSSAGFAVSLALRRPDGSELAHATGRGRGLAEAVRAAMTPLVRADLLPLAAALDPEVAAWARTADPVAALAVVDLTFAFAHNAGGLPDECRRFDALAERVGELGLEGRTMCAYVLGRPAPDREGDRVALRASPTSSEPTATIATRIRLDYLLGRIAPPGAADRLHALFASEPTPRGRGQLAASESCLRGATDPRGARELAIVAVQSEPKNPEGGWCNPWEQLMTLERDTPGAEAALRAMQAWVPWNSYAWLEAGFGTNARAAAALPMLRRAYALSPFDAQVADTLASSALATGDRSTARGIALALRGGGLPLHQVASDLLLVRVESSEARFGAALQRALRGSQLSGDDAGWVHAQRFEMAWRALELAVLLGRGRQVADQLIARFLEPEPPPLDGRFASVPMRVPAICALASQPARCFTRYRALRPQLPGAITEDTDAFLLGAERYVQRDLPGAARAWRPLLGGKMALALALPDAMAEVFSTPGPTFAPELAARVDNEVMKRAGELNGATLGHVRAARRAAATGDRSRARQLAEQVIAAWALADEPPPALEQARKLRARLR